MIEKLKDLEQEAMDNLTPEEYETISEDIMDDYQRPIYQTGYIDGLQTAIRMLHEEEIADNNDYSINSSTLTAEDYFYKAFDYGNSGKYQLAIENYTKCLRIDPDYAPQAYYNRGWNYGQLENYEDAIADFTKKL